MFPIFVFCTCLTANRVQHLSMGPTAKHYLAFNALDCNSLTSSDDLLFIYTYPTVAPANRHLQIQMKWNETKTTLNIHHMVAEWLTTCLYNIQRLGLITTHCETAQWTIICTNFIAWGDRNTRKQVFNQSSNYRHKDCSAWW